MNAITTLEYLRTQKRQQILALAQKHGIQSVQLFGSVVREEDTDGSDIDFLITLSKESDIFDWLRFWSDLEHLLERKVDVLQEKNLHTFIKSGVLAEAQPL